MEDILSETDTKNLLPTAAEYFSGASLSTLPYDSSNQEGLVIFYDKEFKVCTADDARYMLSATIDQGEQKETLLISVYNYDHVSIYDLSVSLHRPMTRKEALQ